MKPFVTERSKTYERKNAQFADCQRHNRPLVIVTPRRSFAMVEVDMFPTDRNLDHTAIEQIAAAFAEYTPAENIKVSAVQCVGERVPATSAESLAKKLYDTVVAAMPQLPPAVLFGGARG